MAYIKQKSERKFKITVCNGYKPHPRNAPPGRFCPAARKARGTGCSNPPFCCPIKSMQNKKSSTP